MRKTQESKRRKAYVLDSSGGRKVIVIGITEQELQLIKRGKIPIECVKNTREFLVYRRKK